MQERLCKHNLCKHSLCKHSLCKHCLCRLLDSEAVSEVLMELRRLMANQDPVRLLLSDPSWMLRVERGPKRLGVSPDT
jgi:hypothetical protein